jgi:hypothetical protein
VAAAVSEWSRRERDIREEEREGRDRERDIKEEEREGKR